MHCYRRFNVDIMKLDISDLDYARKLKLSNNAHLPSINVSISLSLSDSLQYRRGLYLIKYYVNIKLLGC